MPPKLIQDLEITQTADKLTIRPYWKLAIVWAVVACVLGPLALSEAYRSTMGGAGGSASGNHAVLDRIAFAFAWLTALPFVILPVAATVDYARSRRRAWVFDRESGQLTRRDQSWPLASITAVEVVTRRAKGAFFTTDESARVVLRFGESDTLELLRNEVGQNESLDKCIREVTELANTVGDFLQLPVQHPPLAPPGFEVVQPEMQMGKEGG